MANITRFDPFGEMVTLRQAMDRLFEDSVVSPIAWRHRRRNGAPALDVHQTDDEIVVTAALPGLKPEDVEITITGQTLSIRGEFKEDGESSASSTCTVSAASAASIARSSSRSGCRAIRPTPPSRTAC